MRQRNFDLTERELELLSRHGNEFNFKPKDTCKALNIALGTYKVHIHRILWKTDSVNQYEAFFKLAHEGKIINKRWEGLS